MRAFIAVNLDHSLRAAIAETQEQLRASGADVKWVDPDLLHLTLKFLGWVDDSRVPAVIDATTAALAGQPAFRLSLSGVGAFPTPTAPRVVWIGISEGAEELAALAEGVESALEPLGFEREERPFSPHATIGRVKSPAGRRALVEAMAAVRERSFGAMGVAKVELMRSDLRPSGPIYTSQRAFELRRRERDDGC